jgi:hypothetical protein
MIYDRPFEHHPFALFAAALVLQWLGAYLGHLLRKRRESPHGAERADLSAILGATMTLLALLFGFTFSMAISHYDERKRLEDAEATAISAAYVRADLLPADAATQVRDLLSRYVQQRILFYQVNDPARLRQIRSETERLETKLWSAVVGSATAAPTPVTALAVSGMNDVLNSEAHTDAAWRRHVPVAAWDLMGLIAFSANLLLGASAKRKGPGILVVLPLVMSIPAFLIANIDSPRAGLIRVTPVDLIAHAQSLRPKP